MGRSSPSEEGKVCKQGPQHVQVQGAFREPGRHWGEMRMGGDFAHHLMDLRHPVIGGVRLRGFTQRCEIPAFF